MNPDAVVEAPTVTCAVCFKQAEEAQILYDRNGKPFGGGIYSVCTGCLQKISNIFDICPQCTKPFVNLAVWGIKVDGKTLCLGCGLIGKKICLVCQEAHDEADVSSIKLHDIGWSAVCKTCAAKLKTCAGCKTENIQPRNLIYHSRKKNTPGDGFCADCYNKYYWCEACLTIKTASGDVDYDPFHWNDHRYCPECFKQRFITCEDCGGYVPRDNAVEENGDLLCTGCYTQRTRHRVTAAHKETGNIFNYRFDVPRGLNVRVDSTKKLFGVELEVCIPESDEPQTHAAKVYRQGHDMVVCKSDSSIRYGFEIVTAPLEMQPLQEVLRDVLKVKTLQEHSSCGMHVHMNRHTIPRPAIAKTILFMHEPGNRGFINWVARRDAEFYASLSARKWKDAGLFAGVNETTLNTHLHEVQNIKDTRYVAGIPQHMRRTTGWQNGGRYQAINLCNKNTIEFRIFAATTDPDMASANLEFCQALIDYTTELRPMAQVKSAKDFVEYVKAHRKVYPAFHSRLEKEAQAVEKALAFKPPKPSKECGHLNPNSVQGMRCNLDVGHEGNHRRIHTSPATGTRRTVVSWYPD